MKEQIPRHSHVYIEWDKVEKNKRNNEVTYNNAEDYRTIHVVGKPDSGKTITIGF
jgi:hypothetical protein